MGDNGEALGGASVSDATAGLPPPEGGLDRPGTPGDAPPAPPAPSRSKGWLRSTLEWIVVIAVAGLVAFGLKTYVVEPFYIPSNSMEPTLQIGDRVVVDKAGYRWQDVERGDIVVFDAPPGSNQEGHLVKRVLGLPGDEVVGENGLVYVNGEPVSESYTAGVTKNFGPEQVPSSQYWVMGDNRAVSLDSTIFGPIDESDIVGRGEAVVWPTNRLQRIGPTNPWAVLGAVVAVLALVTLVPWAWKRARRSNAPLD